MKLGKDWIKQALQVHDKYPELGIVCPNFHLLIEVLLRGLPQLMDMHMVSTMRYEKHHRLNKEYMQMIRYNVDSFPEAYAIKRFVTVTSLNFIFQGGRWGQRHELKAGDGIIAMLKDPNLTTIFPFAAVPHRYVGCHILNATIFLI